MGQRAAACPAGGARSFVDWLHAPHLRRRGFVVIELGRRRSNIELTFTEADVSQRPAQLRAGTRELGHVRELQRLECVTHRHVPALFRIDALPSQDGGHRFWSQPLPHFDRPLHSASRLCVPIPTSFTKLTDLLSILLGPQGLHWIHRRCLPRRNIAGQQRRRT